MDIENNKKYKELFISEAHEHLDALDAGLIEFEKDKTNTNVVKELMRHAHTLKGIAASIGYGEISNLSHSFEGMVENIKNKLAKGGVDLLFGAADELRRLVDLAEDSGPTHAANPLVDEVGELEHDDKKDDASIIENPDQFEAIHEVRVRTEKLDSVMDIVSEMTINKLNLESSYNALRFKSEHRELMFALKESINKNNRLIEQLQEDVMQLRLTPVGQVFNRFPRMVRDLSKKQNKKVNLHVSGSEIELDRNLLDAIGEPLVHLLRNAVDHGISESGDIYLHAIRVKDQVHLQISDTGDGIQWDKVEKEYIERFGDKDDVGNTEMLFSGLSTNDVVTEISGRGVGLGVVKDTIEGLSGSIEVESPIELDDGSVGGTRFTIQLPVSLAIIQALIVQDNEHRYAIPLSAVERLVNPKEYGEFVQADQRILVVDEIEVPLVSLTDMLKYNSTRDTSNDLSNSEIAMLIRKRNDLVGFTVDKILVQQDVIVKPLPLHIRKNVGFSAMTILGDGTSIPILDAEFLYTKI